LIAVDEQLVLATAITGTVAGPGGSPVAGSRVSAYDADARWIGTAITTTGADGTYRVSSMPANPYWVLVSPPAGSGLTARWFDGTTVRSSAMALVVADGTVTPAIDVTLG